MGETKLYMGVRVGVAQLSSEPSSEGKKMAVSSFTL